MGQKVCPIGFRVVYNKDWRSVWFATKQEFGKLLVEDSKLRSHLLSMKSMQATSRISIYRMSDKIEVTVHTARPGLVIGKKGSEIDALKKHLTKMFNKEVWVEVEEIKRPDLDAYLVAKSIARQIERRVAYRRALKKAIQTTMEAGAKGVKVQIAGRLSGADIARSEWYKDCSTPLHTIK